jgi:hypothetical protein
MNKERELTIDELGAVSGGNLALPLQMVKVLSNVQNPPPPPCGAAAGVNSLDHPIHPC